MVRNERNSFVMYASFLEAAEVLDPAAFKECILKLRDYALYGQDVKSKDPVVNTILTMAKPNLNAAAQRYQQCVENGSKGKDDDTVETIQSPAAMEPTMGSGEKNEYPSSILFNSIFKPDASGGLPQETVSLIIQQISTMSDRELANRYEQDIDKMARARANGGQYKNEALLATEAAMILQRYDKVTKLVDAKVSVVQDVNAAVQLIQQDTAHQVRGSITVEEEDECEKPF